MSKLSHLYVRWLASATVHNRLERLVPFTPSQFFDVAADVDAYHSFLPFCQQSKVVQRDQHRVDDWPQRLDADMSIGFGIFRESYRSRIEMDRPYWIHARALDSSLFQRMESTWRFEERPHDYCFVQFEIEFEARSLLHKTALSLCFTDVAGAQLAAFVDRVETLYGHASARMDAPEIAAESKGADKIDSSIDQNDVLGQAHARLSRIVIHGETGSTGRFTVIEWNAIHDALKRFSCVQPMDQHDGELRFGSDQFAQVLLALKDHGVAFHRFRERCVLLALFDEPSIIPRLLENLCCHDSDHMDAATVLVYLYCIVRATPLERLRFSLGRERPMTDVLTLNELVELTLKHFDLQFDILRIVLPRMVLDFAKSSKQKREEHLASTDGITLLATMGAMETTFDEAHREARDEITHLARVFNHQNDLPLSAWLAAWRDRRDLIDVLSAPGISRVINWVSAMSSK